MEKGGDTFDVYVVWRKIENDSSLANLLSCRDELLAETANREMTEIETAVHSHLKVKVAQHALEITNFQSVT
ncbi:MAG: hypothetical protein HGA36_05120 [Candidatus Moranbacteria bacterium]|nr:hypothetical protein [Candidatus Moranbacteria bacterium]